MFQRSKMWISVIHLAIFAAPLNVAAQVTETPRQAIPRKVKDAKVKTKVEHLKGEKSIIIEMIENPGIPDPPSPPPPLTEAQKEAIRNSPAIQARIRRQKETKLIFLSATVVDRERTLLRWSHEKEEYRAWSSIDFNFFRGTNHFKVEDSTFLLFMGIGDVSTGDSRVRQQTYTYPALKGQGARFELIKGDSSNSQAMASIEALHTYFQRNKELLKKAFAQREKREAARLEDLRNNPPIPQDTIIKFWPRKGSRYLKKHEEEVGK